MGILLELSTQVKAWREGRIDDKVVEHLRAVLITADLEVTTSGSSEVSLVVDWTPYNHVPCLHVGLRVTFILRFGCPLNSPAGLLEVQIAVSWMVVTQGVLCFHFFVMVQLLVLCNWIAWIVGEGAEITYHCRFDTQAKLQGKPSLVHKRGGEKIT